MSFEFQSAAEMARQVRKKQISPVELVRAHFDRIDELNPRLNAFVHVRREDAMNEARLAETAAVRGEGKPLSGVPISIKSCIDVAGLPCEAGSRLRADHVPGEDAILVRRLREAGAIVLGNTNTAEMLMAYDSDNILYGRTNNPWDLRRTAGGSSGGEAAAIASGMSAAGIGSDGGGSIRVPAHFTGICGLKPTPGRIPTTGHFPAGAGPFAWLGVVGPMARTVEDLRLMLLATAGADPGDPMAADYSMAPVTANEIRGLRIGVVDCSGHEISAEIEAAVQNAGRCLRESGLVAETVELSELSQARELWEALFVRVGGGMLVAEIVQGREAELSPALQEYVRVAQSHAPLTASDVLNALFLRDSLRANFLKRMDKFPILLAPVCAALAFLHGEGGWDDSFPTNYLRQMMYSQWFNLLGNPAAVVPVGQSREGLPIGVQVIGRPYEELLVLEVARMIEKSFGWKAPAMDWRRPRTLAVAPTVAQAAY